MARTTKKKEPVKETAVVTRAEKKDAAKNVIRELLAVKPYKHNELLDEVAKLYTERFGGEDTENVNDVKGRIGSVLDIMKKESEVAYEGGMYALKARALPQPPAEEEKPVKKTTRKKAVEKKAKEETKTEDKGVEKPKKTTRKKTVKAEKTEKAEEPAPVALEEVKTEEKPAPKKRGRKPKAKVEKPIAETVAEAPVETVKETPKAEEPAPVIVEEVKAEEQPAKAEQPEPIETPAEEVTQLVVKEKAEVAKKNVVMDMSFLFGGVKSAKMPTKAEEKPAVALKEAVEKKAIVKAEEKTESPAQEEKKPTMEKVQNKPAEKTAEKPVKKPQKTENKAPVSATNVKTVVRGNVRGLKNSMEKPLTADEKLREAFLKKLRTLGGDYFEYYSVYLLERYSMKNGRRLEGLRINGGDRDGGIDGEIELTDKLGFKETIYIQSKNWNPDKGDEKLWVVGETLLQQFIGACACRQAKDGKQNCRGIFITTSRFTPEAKRILDTMSDKIVGYDGNDLYEAAKECSFGLVRKNGEWALDEKLLSGSKVFFNLY